MPVTARPMPRPRSAGRIALARPVHSTASAATRTNHAKAPPADRIRLVLLLAAVAIAGIVAIGVIWEFGAGRNLPVGTMATKGRGGADRAGDQPTLLYRDMRNGRVMVMEIGADGTRIKGTIPKSDLGIAADMGADVGTSTHTGDVTSADRVNALGSAFRK